MGVFKRYSSLGTGMTFDEFMARMYSPCFQRRRSSYLAKKDVLRPCYEFSKLPEDKSQLRISEINLHDDEEVKQLRLQKIRKK